MSINDKKRPFDWRLRIEVRQDIPMGKPVVKGTRLSVEFLLGLFAEGWNEQQIIDNYPQITLDDLRAVFSFIVDCLHDEAFVPLVRASR